MKKVLMLFLMFFISPAFATGIGATATAPCDNATLSKYTGTADIEINWEPNTINLNWYDGDTKLTVANNSQTCVYDGTLTVPTQPTKPGYTFNGWKVIRVPGGFTELQYLESTGTQYINTNVYYQTNDVYRQVIDMQFKSLGSGQFSGIFGGGYFGIAGSKWSVGGTGGHESGITNVSADTNRHVFDLSTTIGYSKDMVLKIDNDTYTNNRDIRSGYAGVLNLPDNELSSSCSAKLYSAKFYKFDNLVFNGIPARRDSDNVVGMYDTITGQFFTNAGTGDFIAGPAVQ